MRIVLHIGLPGCGVERLQTVMDAKRGALTRAGVHYSGIGRRNHTKLYMSVSEPGHIDPLRAARGFHTTETQAKLAERVAEDLAQEVATHTPDTLVLSAQQLATLPNGREVRRLRDLLTPLSDQIDIVAHVDEQARMMLAHYAEAVMSGRTASLGQELGLPRKTLWRKAALGTWGPINPALMGFGEIQAAPHWLDLLALRDMWESVFGAGRLHFRPYEPARFYSPRVTDEITEMLGITGNLGKAGQATPPLLPSAETLARARALNGVFAALAGKGKVLSRQIWTRFLEEVAIDGPAHDPGELSVLSARFAPDNAALVADNPELGLALTPAQRQAAWSEPAFTHGYRATQYAAAALPRIEDLTAQAKAQPEPKDSPTAYPKALGPTAERLLNPRAKENYAHLRTGRFAPHNRLGRDDEAEPAEPYATMTPRQLPPGSTGNVIVGCMKNEAPYIVEWIAHHRAIGIDNFLIYTNDCTDGTAQILDRLMALGVVEHRDNTAWKGNSPQQHALNKSLSEPVIQNADWVIHIDVDEFMNVRCGNGTLDDFLDRVPDATNVAMTWRLFGHNGVTDLSRDLVIAQFDEAAPKYCPKPHTAWGFKTMTKNIGAYQKLSCHRPNKLDDGHRALVQWVNGNGEVMNEGYKDKGWRSDLRTVGYDLLQLNHYALRSAESFLIKRQRGRALHVDRSIGLNYWVRMDWNGHKDVTIQRNIPRVRAEMERLLADPELAALHEVGYHWHRAKADELHDTPEFQELYAQALDTKLNDLERVAFALSLDMDS